jgi:uncharacterized protein YjcR
MRTSHRPDGADLYRQYVLDGMTIRDLADRYGVAPMTVHRWLRDNSITRRPRGRQPGSDRHGAR